MCELAKQWRVALAVAVVLSVGLAGQVAAADEQEQQILDAFGRGITLYETGDYAAARAAFDQLLTMEPGMQTALKMRDMAELGQFFEMKEVEELREEAERLLDLLTRAARQRKRAVAEPDRLVADFQSPELATYGNARIELLGHGPYAVPYVVHLLKLDAEEEQTVVARAISLLAELHPDACLPLIEVLSNTDSTLLKTRAADVLGQIGDPRAVPALMAVLEDEAAGADVKGAAEDALLNITGRMPEDLGSAAEQYVDLAGAYFAQDKARVGYTYALSADIWEWNPAGADLAEQVVYEEVPVYLNYQRMATEVALDGLAAEPGNAQLQALLGAALVRQLALCEFFKGADMRLGGKEVTDDIHQDAAVRAEALGVQAPVVLRMLKTPVLAQALRLALGAGDGPAALYLVKALGDKLAASGPGALEADVAEVLAAALDSGDKDVRYNAAIVLVAAGPGGELAPPQKVMDVMGAALKAAADRNALIIMDNFQMRNKLVNVLYGLDVATIESTVLEPRIESALALEPSVDIVFLAGNVEVGKFTRIMTLLKGDPRTMEAPLYVVVDPTAEAPRMSDYEGIADVIGPDALRTEAVQPIVEEQVFARSRSAFTDAEEALVLKAARALAAVNPLATAYPLAVLEPPLVKALTGYSEEVSAAAVAALAEFGSSATVEPLAELVSGDGSVALRSAACRAVAAVLKRTGAAPAEDVVAVLKDTLAGEDQAMRQAAAEALSAAGLPAGEVLALVRTEGLGEQ
ncbi:MAG: hypothetical protein AMK73_09365 [Planctomycetes bacterium SM23_32]|nr:MAG: hypothetical protein AMK73_09365 [Planctomycetes bacterium SM23_32]